MGAAAHVRNSSKSMVPGMAVGGGGEGGEGCGECVCTRARARVCVNRETYRCRPDPPIEEFFVSEAENEKEQEASGGGGGGVFC